MIQFIYNIIYEVYVFFRNTIFYNDYGAENIAERMASFKRLGDLAILNDRPIQTNILFKRLYVVAGKDGLTLLDKLHRDDVMIGAFGQFSDVNFFGKRLNEGDTKARKKDFMKLLSNQRDNFDTIMKNIDAEILVIANKKFIDLSIDLDVILYKVIAQTVLGLKKIKNVSKISKLITKMSFYVSLYIFNPYIKYNPQYRLEIFNFNKKLDRTLSKLLKDNEDAILEGNNGIYNLAKTIADETGRDIKDCIYDKRVKDNYNMLTFLLAENTLTLTGLSVYKVAEDSSLLEKIDNEIKNYDNISYDDVGNLKFTDRLLKETLRYYHLAPMVSRSVHEATRTESGHLLEKGRTVIIPSMSMQHSRKYYKNPEVFDPDRFNDKIPNEANIPFGWGSRSCPGRNFAQLAAKIVIFKLFSKYNVRVLDTKKEYVNKGLPIKIKPATFVEISEKPVELH